MLAALVRPPLRHAAIDSGSVGDHSHRHRHGEAAIMSCGHW